jgi:transcriptional regulator with XRE-family HTH domain
LCEYLRRVKPELSDSFLIRAEVGARLRSERSRLGLNQADFGRLAAVSRRTQAGYEGGEGAPGTEYLAALAREGVDILYIVTGIPAGFGPSAVEEAPRTWAGPPPEGLRPAEVELVESFRRMSPPDQAAFRRLARSLAGRSAGVHPDRGR